MSIYYRVRSEPLPVVYSIYDILLIKFRQEITVEARYKNNRYVLMRFLHAQ